MDEAQSPDVPASAVTRRTRLAPEAARFRYARNIPVDPRGACQVCCVPGERLVVFEAVVDPSNGQRITLALCWGCVMHGVRLFGDPAPDVKAKLPTRQKGKKR